MGQFGQVKKTEALEQHLLHQLPAKLFSSRLRKCKFDTECKQVEVAPLT